MDNVFLLSDVRSRFPLFLFPFFIFDAVGQVPVPRSAEVAVAPSPLLLAWREVVTGYVEHAGLGVVLIATFEVILRVDGHVARWHLDVLVVGDIHAGRVVHFVISACGYRKT